MKLLHTTVLTEEQKTAVLALVDACKKAEPITLSAAVEDRLDYFLSYEGEQDGTLAGYGFLFFTESPEPMEEGSSSAEFMAFVHPDCRRKGHFTGMLNAALACAEAYEKKHGQNVDFYFLTDQKSADASAVLEAIGAEYWYSEYKMDRFLTEKDRQYRPEVEIRREAPAPGESELYTAVLDGRAIGACAVIRNSCSAYLYSFQIREDYQSQGHGKDFLLGMLALLASSSGAGDSGATNCENSGSDTTSSKNSDPGARNPENGGPGAKSPEEQNITSVSVQVSGLNYIARNLYKKTGFRTADTLSYYIF